MRELVRKVVTTVVKVHPIITKLKSMKKRYRDERSNKRFTKWKRRKIPGKIG